MNSLSNSLSIVGFLTGDQNKLNNTLKIAKASSELSSGNVSGAATSILAGSENPLQRFQTLLGLRDADFDGKLKIIINSAESLPDLDNNFTEKGGSDPYVSVKIDGIEKGKTCIADDAQNPVWNQVIDFDFTGKISNISLELWDDDICGDDSLGQVVISGNELFENKVIKGPKNLEGKIGEDYISGKLCFSVEYIPPSFDGKLEIFINNAKNIRDCDTFGKSDPYVVVLLDEYEIFRTKTIESSHCPEWNEQCVRLVAGERTNIYVSVWDDDAGKDDYCGHLKFNTKQIVSSKIIEGSFELLDKDNSGDISGLLDIKLVYTPPQLDGDINITIKEAIGLASKDDSFFGGCSDPYVVIQVDGNEVGRTSVKNNSNNPCWNEDFKFTVSPNNKFLTIEIMDDDYGEDDSLGFIRISAVEIAVRKSIDEELVLRGNRGDLSIKGKLSLALNYINNVEDDPIISEVSSTL